MRFMVGFRRSTLKGLIQAFSFNFSRPFQIYLVSLSILCLANASVWGQIKHYQHFGVEDGLLTNRLTSVVEGPDGFIWITTNGSGISRFDGQNFEHYGERDVVGSPYYFSSLRLGDDLWFGGENFLSLYRDQKFKKYLIPHVGAIRQVVAFQDSILFCLSETGAFCFSIADGKKKEIEVPDVYFNQSVVFNQNIWTTTDLGVWEFNGSKWDKMYPEEENQPVNCEKIMVSPQGIFFIDRYQGLIHLYGDEGAVILSPDDLPSHKITFLKNGSLGDIYFGTEDRGIQIFQRLDSLWLEIDEQQLHFPQVTDMIFDRWENAWVTSDGGGLTKFYSESFILHPFLNLSGSYITKLENWTDTLVVNYQNNRRDIIAPNRNISPILDRRRRVFASDIFDDFHYFFTKDSAVFWRDTSTYRFVLPKIDRSEQLVNLYQIDSSCLLQVTDRSVSTLNLGIVDSTPSLRRLEILELPIKSAVQATNGFYWILGNELLVVVQDSQVLAHTFVEHPLFVLQSPTDEILLGTRDAIYFVHYQDGEIEINKILPGTRLVNVRAATFADDGNLWIALQDQLVKCKVDALKSMEVLEVYDHQNGLPRLEFLEGALQSGYSNRIYAGTSGGLLELLPQTNLQSALGPILSIIEIKTANDDFYQMDAAVMQQLRQIEPNDSDLSIKVKAIDQRLPQRLEFFYRLFPKDSDWIESTSGGNFQFLGLPPGQYRFRVKAVNVNSQESNIIEVPITVLNPLHKRWWVILLCLFFLFGFFYIFYRWRLGLQLRKKEVQNEMLKTENKILQLEQSASRLQMNPHFIFNALQSIQSSIVDGDREKARNDLQTFSRLMRSYLEHARVERIGLEDEIKLLDQYLSLEKELKGGRFDYEIVIDPAVDPSLVEIPTMLIQPFVENAIKHGQPRDGKKGKIQLTFDWFGKYLRCIIRDNGPGIERDIKFRSHRSAGVDITRQRLETYFRDETLKPLTIESDELKGTVVRVLLRIAN